MQAASALIAGILLSGPLALLIVALVAPQPAWVDPAQFAAAYDPVQLLPYAGGFVLVGACVALIASLRPLAVAERRVRCDIALALTAAFAAMIFLNYVLQTTFVPSLVRPYRAENAGLVSAFAMANPRSLAWALEMWGYGVLGVATGLVACVFDHRTPVERLAGASYRGNAVLSVASAVATAACPGWVTSGPGLVAFAVWNLWMVAMAALTIAAMVQRRSGR